MPGVDGYSFTDKETRKAADIEFKQRKAWHDRVWSYYNGEHPKPLKLTKNRIDNNVILNLVAPHVDSTVAFAAPAFPLLSLDEVSTVDNADEQLLKALWKKNRPDVWLQNAMTYGTLEGHVFVRVIDKPSLSPQSQKHVRLVILNPGNIIPFWQGDDFETLLYYELRYTANGEQRCQHIISPEAGASEQWVTQEFIVKNEGLIPNGSPMFSPYRPIVDWQHLPHPARFWGKHEMDNSLNLNDGINKTASDMKSILRLYANPFRVGYGIDPKLIQETAIEGFLSLPEDSRVEQLEMNGDLTASMNFLLMLHKMYMEQARVTQLTGGPEDYKGITNLGIKAAFKNQMEKTEVIRRQYGDAIAQISQIMMEINGKVISEPSVLWKDSLPISEVEVAQTVQVKRGMGLLSKESAAQELGIDWAKEKPLVQDEMPESAALAGIMA